MTYYGYEFVRESDLTHHGILGQKWGIRRFQNLDGTLTRAGRARKQSQDDRSMDRDVRWAKRHEKRITKKANSQVRREMRSYEKHELKELRKQTKRGKDSRAYMNAYNKKLAELMNTAVTDIETPSGRAVRFIAKRGDYGVYMAVADKGYDMKQVKNGIYTSGRIAYRKSSVERS